MKEAIAWPLKIKVGATGNQTQITDAEGRPFGPIKSLTLYVDSESMTELQVTFTGVPAADVIVENLSVPAVNDKQLELLAGIHGYHLVPREKDDTDDVPIEGDLLEDPATETDLDPLS